MENELALKVDNVKKRYRLGVIGGGTLQGDIQSWWARVRGKEDPNTKIGTTTDTKKGSFMALDGISFEVKKQERVALIGPNGIGKTTLFHILLGDIIPTCGKVKLGSKVMMGYYDQEHTSLSFDKTIFQEISDAYPQMNNTQIRNACASFQFKGEDVFKSVDMLSGGERGRVVLMKLLLSRSNFLILDEPTNHLDIESKEVLEDALLSFEGTILFISHDRYFINELATHCLYLSKNHVIFESGDYNRIYNVISKLNEELYNFEKKTDSEYAEMMKEARKRIYSQYSSYAHNDFMYCFIGCHSTDQTNEMVNYNLWGNYNYNAKYILSSVNDLLWMMFLYFKSFMSQDNIFDKEDFITKDYYKYWNDALFISVILDEQKRKETDKNNDEQGE